MANISRTNRSLDRSHTGLVLFDALHGYLHPTAPEKIAFLETHKILPNLQRLLAGARSAGLTVFYPSGAHAADGSDTVERLTDTDMDLGSSGGGATKIKPRFHKGSDESEIAAELAPVAGDLVIKKNRWNAFFQTNLEFQLRVRGIDTIVLAGGSTDVGIASTAFAARDFDLGLVIVRDACFSMRGNNNDFFMDRVFPRMGRVMTVDDVVKLMATTN
jgi:ureidoacrylate peracid hydrolase